MVKKIIASRLVIIEKGKLIVSRDEKDNFYKIPGGRVEKEESLEETCVREFFEETGLEREIIEKLHTQKLYKDPQTGEPANIEPPHYKCKLKIPPTNYNSFEYNGHQIHWLDINEIKNGKYNVAPNIKFLIEKGDIK
ncbi:hypothetical protein DRN69_02215 [Candidatus Pacearchaeota archaeon]|nr:MAG: hypothetical protein DRN69_02215 [Candidatus Pacearchaeota archaeon]